MNLPLATWFAFVAIAALSGAAVATLLLRAGRLQFHRPRRDPRSAGEHGGAIAGPAHTLHHEPIGTTGDRTSARSPVAPDSRGVREPGAAPAAAEAYTLGGREFVVTTESTIAQDLWAMRLIEVSGLNRPTMLRGEDPEAFARRIVAEAVGRIDVCELLGAILIPAGTTPEDWTPQVARETAAHIAGLRDPEAKAVVTSLVASLMFDFFAKGLATCEISSSSPASGSDASGAVQASPSPRPASPGTASGTSSSEPSPAATTTPPVG